MKTNNVLLIFALFISISTFAQEAKTKIAVSYLDVKGLTLDPSQAGNLARKELAKTEKFNVSVAVWTPLLAILILNLTMIFKINEK